MNGMNCPRCQAALTCDKLEEFSPGVTVTGIEVDICNQCNGIWFDKGELERVENVIEPTYFEFRKIPGAREQELQLECPKCKNRTMEKAENKRDKKVIMDVCPQCKGIWLDGGELKAIREENIFAVLGKLIKDVYSD